LDDSLSFVFKLVDHLLGKVGSDISLKLTDDKLPVKEGELAYLHFFAWKTRIIVLVQQL
jgi:hypothetical protein